MRTTFVALTLKFAFAFVYIRDNRVGPVLGLILERHILDGTNLR